jgi:hypothetical protein
MPNYQQLNENLSLERNQVIAIYTNCFISFILFFILVGIAATLSPVTKDASILINDAGTTLKDISIIIPEINQLIPEINQLIPEAKNTTRILGHFIPRINQGLYILRQICRQDPQCHL